MFIFLAALFIVYVSYDRYDEKNDDVSYMIHPDWKG